MCDGGGSSDDIRKQQQQQQRQIQRGTQYVNSVFDGGTLGSGLAKTYVPGQQYYNLSGTPYVFDPSSAAYRNWVNTEQPRQGFKSRRGVQQDSDEPQLSPAELQKRYMESLISQGQLYTGTQSFSGFTPSFYDDRQNAFVNYAQPFLSQQFGDTSRALQYRLADQGLLRSSGGQQLRNNLAREYSTQQTNIANQALSQRQSLQQQVEAQRQSLIGQLQVASDPLSVAGQAIGAASQFSAPSPMPAVGNLFSNFANMYLGRQLNNAYATPQNDSLNTFKYFFPTSKTSTIVN